MSQCTIERTIWQLPRTGAWFQHLMDEFSVQEWYENFRLSRATFQFLVEELKPELKFQDTKMRKAVKVENKVALFLFFIASTASYRTLSNLFGLSRGFVCIRIRKVAAAVLRKLRPKYMSVATGDELARVIANYKEKWGVSHVRWSNRWHTYTNFNTTAKSCRLHQQKIIPQYCDASVGELCCALLMHERRSRN